MRNYRTVALSARSLWGWFHEVQKLGTVWPRSRPERPLKGMMMKLELEISFRRVPESTECCQRRSGYFMFNNHKYSTGKTENVLVPVVNSATTPQGRLSSATKLGTDYSL